MAVVDPSEITDEQRERFVALYMEAVDEARLPSDAACREAVGSHAEFGSRVAQQNSWAETDADDQRLLRQLFGKIDVAHNADQARDEPGPFDAKGRFDRLMRLVWGHAPTMSGDAELSALSLGPL